MQAWSSNRIKRLARQPKRYLVDSGLLAAVLGMDRAAIIRDGDILGRLIGTFVLAQLRPELAIAETRPHLYHLRDKNGDHEVDLLAELGGGRIIGIEASRRRHQPQRTPGTWPGCVTGSAAASSPE